MEREKEMTAIKAADDNDRATGEVGQDACYAEDIDGNVLIDQPCQIIVDEPPPWDDDVCDPAPGEESCTVIHND